MGFKSDKVLAALLTVMLWGLNAYCQGEGESERISFSIKRADVSKAGISNQDRNIADITPPNIKIISPQIDTTSTGRSSASHIYLIGRLLDDSGIQSVMINDSIVPHDENGFFQTSCHLTEGLNVYEVRATDELDNTSTRLIQLILEMPDERMVSSSDGEFAGDYYGLIIGVNEYNDHVLVDLDHPITDATMLYSTLIGNYRFSPENMTMLKNPTRAEIINKLDEFRYQLSAADNLIIFFAGHGYWDSERETGFWLPTDADHTSTVNWIRNSTVQDFVDDIQTRHTLLITDACFAGSIFKSRGAFSDASIGVNKLYSLPSRKAMTSGTLEEVPDRSVFLEYLLKRLLDNDEKYISASGLFNSFRDAVLNNSPNIPQYGVIQNTGDEGGDFIFIRK